MRSPSTRPARWGGMLLAALGLWLLVGAPAAAHPAAGDEEDHAHAGEAHGEHDPQTAHDGESSGGHHGDAEHAEHGAAPNPLVIDPDLGLFTFLVFFIVFAVLHKFAWGPILESLQQREQQIEQNLAVAKGQAKEAQRLQSEYDHQLNLAAEEVRELLEEARRKAEAEKAEIVGQAKSEAQQQLDRELAEVIEAKKSALQQVGQSTTRYAAELAGRITEKSVRIDSHRDTVQEVAERFAHEA